MVVFWSIDFSSLGIFKSLKTEEPLNSYLKDNSFGKFFFLRKRVFGFRYFHVHILGIVSNK